MKLHEVFQTPTEYLHVSLNPLNVPLVNLDLHRTVKKISNAQNRNEISSNAKGMGVQ